MKRLWSVLSAIVLAAALAGCGGGGDGGGSDTGGGGSDGNGGEPGGSLVFTRIDYPGAYFTYVENVDESRRVSGWYLNSGDDKRYGFVKVGEDDAGYTSVNYSGAVSTYVRGFDASGRIFGDYETAGGAWHGFVQVGESFDSLVTVDCPELGAIETEIIGIDASGKIFGNYKITGDVGLVRGFEKNGVGAACVSIVYQGVSAEISGVDASGRVYGSYTPPQFANLSGQPVEYAFVKDGGEYIDVAYPGAEQTRIINIAASGPVFRIFGYYETGNRQHGFVKEGKEKDKGYIPIDYPGAYDTYVLGVNSAGEFIGGYTTEYSPNAGDEEHMFVKTGKEEGKGYTSIDYQDPNVKVHETYLHNITASGRIFCGTYYYGPAYDPADPAHGFIAEYK
ncbi:MAG: hypothetical protein LBI87_07205 [Candidatus Accumulibacter sp.]|jgi:hypothetical protein|nr:hypothetical protein [Accumulibacter sp.]